MAGIEIVTVKAEICRVRKWRETTCLETELAKHFFSHDGLLLVLKLLRQCDIYCDWLCFFYYTMPR